MEPETGMEFCIRDTDEKIQFHKIRGTWGITTVCLMYIALPMQHWTTVYQALQTAFLKDLSESMIPLLVVWQSSHNTVVITILFDLRHIIWFIYFSVKNEPIQF